MAKETKKTTAKEIEQSKSDRIMEIVAKRGSFYRSNVHRFVEDYLGLKGLKWFQKILLWAAMNYNAFFFCACRGVGKTYLVALFCICRAILYPRSLIIVSSYTFKQGKETINKITNDFMQRSPMLRSEIKRVSTGLNECGVWFHNGSSIEVKVAAESSRGARCNVLVIDESRQVKRSIIDTILIPMLNAPRSPGYLRNPKYEDRKEIGKILQMSSAWYKQSEMYEDVKTYMSNMLDENNNDFFICDLPYQVSIESGILMRETIEREMAKQTFNDITFMMEYEGKFYGSTQDALFKFETLNERRILSEPFLRLDYYKLNGVSIPRKQINEKRILSLDIALLASKKHDNDASCFCLNRLMINDDSYISNYVHVDSNEGLLTEELGLITMRNFYQYDCDYLAIDANGIGQAILDFIMQDRYDPEYGVSYKAMTCINNDDLNIRSKSKNTNKCIYAIKANAKMNNDMCLSLRAGIQNGYINLLCNENDIDENLSKIVKGYSKMTESEQLKIKIPYYQTTLLIEEMINLNHSVSNGLIKIEEKSGMRKDRYSSMEYNNYVVDQLRNMKQKKIDTTIDYSKIFTIRQGRKVTRF